MATGNAAFTVVNSNNPSALNTLAALLMDPDYDGIVCYNVTASLNADGESYDIKIFYSGSMLPYAADMATPDEAVITTELQNPTKIVVTYT